MKAMMTSSYQLVLRLTPAVHSRSRDESGSFMYAARQPRRSGAPSSSARTARASVASSHGAVRVGVPAMRPAEQHGAHRRAPHRRRPSPRTARSTPAGASSCRPHPRVARPPTVKAENPWPSSGGGLPNLPHGEHGAAEERQRGDDGERGGQARRGSDQTQQHRPAAEAEVDEDARRRCRAAPLLRRNRNPRRRPNSPRPRTP